MSKPNLLGSELSDVSDASDSKKPYRCSLSWCKAAFSRKWKLTVHMRKHTGERPFACDIPGCSKTYTNKAHLKRHKVLSHEKSEELICDDCQRVFNNRYSLKKHQNIKHKSRMYAFICQDCGQGFERKKQLHEHAFLHTGIKSYRCPDCDVYFSDVSKYEKHVRNHKTYECNCGEKFHKWTLLCAHKREVCKPGNKCEICDKVFTQKRHLKLHGLTHIDEERRVIFDCPYDDCERIFYYKKNLNSHVKHFHLKIRNSEKCPFIDCGAELSSRRILKTHINLIHKTEKTDRKIIRAPRFDKGIRKTSMVSKLSGLPIPKDDHFAFINPGVSNRKDLRMSMLSKPSTQVNMDNNRSANAIEVPAQFLSVSEITATELNAVKSNNVLFRDCNVVLERIQYENNEKSLTNSSTKTLHTLVNAIEIPPPELSASRISFTKSIASETESNAPMILSAETNTTDVLSTEQLVLSAEANFTKDVSAESNDIILLECEDVLRQIQYKINSVI